MLTTWPPWLYVTTNLPSSSSDTEKIELTIYSSFAFQTNARIGEYLGYHDAWNKTTKKNGTIHLALDYALTKNASTTNEKGAIPQMYYVVSAIAAKFGDPTGKYRKFLKT